MKLSIFFLAMALIIAIASCTSYKYNKEYPAPVTPVVCDTTNMSFATNIQPILNANCTSCHNPSGSAAGYGDYTNYSRLLSSNAKNGSLVNDITITDVSSIHHMPYNLPSLSACDIEKITAWVNAGALNN